MADLSNELVIGQLLAVLGEAFEGSAGNGSYFTDQGPEAGLLGTLAKVGASAASRPWGGTSIAAHAHHASFSLEASTSWIRGERKRWDWNASWSVNMVDEAEWTHLREAIAARYADLRRAVESNALSGEEAFGGAVGAIAHMAYHLGAIRQKAAMERKS